MHYFVQIILKALLFWIIDKRKCKNICKERTKLEKNWFNQTKEEVSKYFNVDIQNGLSAEQVKENQAKYGPNDLKILWLLF